MMFSSSIYQIFSDESSHSQGRFRSICAVSGSINILNLLRVKLKNVLKEYNKKEIKWSKIRNDYKKQEIAKNFFDIAINLSCQKKIRIDILVWDIEDSRHEIERRDDEKNFEIMYYKLLRHIGKAYKQKDWEFYPDQRSAINWESIGEYLNNTYDREPGLITLFKEKRFQFNFETIEEQDSKEEPIIQLADLFAGMGCFSRKNSDKLEYWRNCIKSGQMCLFESEINLSNSQEGRFEVMDDFHEKCKEKELGVSLNSNKYLNTPDPWNTYINFWNYAPQHDKDKAPTKN